MVVRVVPAVKTIRRRLPSSSSPTARQSGESPLAALGPWPLRIPTAKQMNAFTPILAMVLATSLHAAQPDWSRSVVIILGTKYLLAWHSAESRPVGRPLKNPVLSFLRRHSLLIFIGVTGIGWAVLDWKMDAQSQWGQASSRNGCRWPAWCS